MLTRANVVACSAALLARPGRTEARHSQTDRGGRKRQVEIWMENEFISSPKKKKQQKKSKTRSLKSTNILLQHESLRFCEGCLPLHP